MLTFMVFGGELSMCWLNGHVIISDTDCIVQLKLCVLTNVNLTTNLIGLDNLYLSWCQRWLSDSKFWILRKHLLKFKGTISQVVNITDSWTFNFLLNPFGVAEKIYIAVSESLGTWSGQHFVHTYDILKV